MVNTKKFSISIPTKLDEILIKLAIKLDRKRNYLIVKAIEQCYGGAALKEGKTTKKVNVLTESYDELAKLKEIEDLGRTYEVPANKLMKGDIDMSKLKHIAKELKSPNKKKANIKKKADKKNKVPENELHEIEVIDVPGIEGTFKDLKIALPKKNNAAPKETKKFKLSEELEKV